MKKQENLELLTKAFGKDVAEELVKLTSNYDKYLLKFKGRVNELLHPFGYELITGLSFEKTDKEKKENS